MRTEIATLGEFGLINHLTEGIKNKMNQPVTVLETMPLYSPILTTRKYW